MEAGGQELMRRFLAAGAPVALAAALFASMACAAEAQGALSVPQQPSATPAVQRMKSAAPGQAAQNPPPNKPPTSKPHRFWDRENILLFSGVAFARGLDYSSTLNIRRRGINEVFLTNSIVDIHPLFAGIEAAGAGASIGVSYIFHRTGHHAPERWTSIVHIGVGVGGALRNYALKTPHPTPAPE